MPPSSFLDQVPTNYSADPTPPTGDPASGAPPTSAPADPTPPVDETTAKPPEQQSQGEPPKDGVPPKKTSAEYAEERRQEKQRKRDMLESFPKIESELNEKKTELEQLRAENERLLQQSAPNGQETLDQQAIDTLRAENERMKKAIDASRSRGYTPVDSDSEVVRYQTDTINALKSQMPHRMDSEYGGITRLNSVDSIMSDPKSGPAFNAAVQHYYNGYYTGDSTMMDEAVTAMGGLLASDPEDDMSSTHAQIDDALRSAMAPMQKGVERQQYVEQNRHSIALEQHSSAVDQVAANLLSPISIPEDRIKETLETDPGNVWAQAADFVNQHLDSAAKAELERSLRSDADVLARLQYVPLPAQGEGVEAIEATQAAADAANQTVKEMQYYASIGKVLIQGGLITNAYEATKRLDGAGIGIGTPPAGAQGEPTGSFLDAVPSEYQKTN